MVRTYEKVFVNDNLIFNDNLLCLHYKGTKVQEFHSLSYLILYCNLISLNARMGQNKLHSLFSLLYFQILLNLGTTMRTRPIFFLFPKFKNNSYQRIKLRSTHHVQCSIYFTIFVISITSFLQISVIKIFVCPICDLPIYYIY